MTIAKGISPCSGAVVGGASGRAASPVLLRSSEVLTRGPLSLSREYT